MFATGPRAVSADEQDLFAVEVEAGTTYRFDLEGRDTGSGSLRDPVLRGILDSSGTRIDDTWDDGGHLSFPHDPTNTLYIASGQLSLPGPPTPGAGVFDYVDDARRLSAPDATKPSEWSLPIGFLPKGRPPLSYHKSPDRWSRCGERARLRSVSRGQEFVLDLALYPELIGWLTEIIAGGRRTR